MRAAVEALAVDLPEEFTGPVGYADRWLWIAVGLAVALVVYYALAWWFTRAPRPVACASRAAPQPRAEPGHPAREPAAGSRRGGREAVAAR